MRVTPEQAGARVVARLGRPAQDPLEAAVVLEAWGGLTPAQALALLGPDVPAQRQTPTAPPPAPPRSDAPPTARWRDGVELAAVLVVTTAWFAALRPDAAGRALLIWALPLIVGLQWLLRRRYIFDDEPGLGCLRRDPVALPLLAGLVLAVPVALAVAPSWAPVLGLAVLSCGALLLAVRRWAVPFTVAVSLCAVATATSRFTPTEDLLTTTGIISVAIIAALVTTRTSSRRLGGWRPGLVSGAVGGGSMLPIALSPPGGLTSPFLLVVLLPSLLASLWAGQHLSSFWRTVRRAMSITTVTDDAPRLPSRALRRVLLGAVARLVGGAAVLSIAVEKFAEATDVPDVGRVAPALLALAAFSVVPLLAALLDGLLQRAAALAVVASAAVPPAADHWLHPLHWTSHPLVLSAVVSVVVALPVLRTLLREPDRLMATPR